MAALASAALADDGWLVLRFDPKGCGDSEGDFSDATWDCWLDDVSFFTRWLNENADGPLLIWTMRAGALLVTDWAIRNNAMPPLLMWQPVFNGRRYLNQFFRLRAAAEMLDSSGAKGVVSELWDKLRDDVEISVAGYSLNPALVNPMSEVNVSLLDKYTAPLTVLEVSGADTPAVTPAVKNLLHKWTENGVLSTASAVSGPPFWQTTEVEVAPSLIKATVKRARELA